MEIKLPLPTLHLAEFCPQRGMLFAQRFTGEGCVNARNKNASKRNRVQNLCRLVERQKGGGMGSD